MRNSLDPARMAPEDRAFVAASLEEMAADFPLGSARHATVAELAALWRCHDRFYPEVALPRGEESGALPRVVRGPGSRFSAYGSPGAMCAEGAGS